MPYYHLTTNTSAGVFKYPVWFSENSSFHVSTFIFYTKVNKI